AAVARVDQTVVVGDAVGERDAVRRVCTGAVDEMRNELHVLLRRRRRGERRRERDGYGRQGVFPWHDALPDVADAAPKTARRLVRCEAGASPRCCADCAPGAAASQYGNGHILSFSLPIAHNRAKPFGSAIKKNTIMAPNSMNSTCEIVAVDISIPSQCGSWLRKIGTRTMKIAPTKEPTLD